MLNNFLWQFPDEVAVPSLPVISWAVSMQHCRPLFPATARLFMQHVRRFFERTFAFVKGRIVAVPWLSIRSVVCEREGSSHAVGDHALFKYILSHSPIYFLYPP